MGSGESSLRGLGLLGGFALLLEELFALLRRRRSRAALMSAACDRTTAWYSSNGTALTCASMFAWLRPHSSAHWPRNVPARVGLEPGLVRVARDRVHLAAELRDPPRVGDVVGGDVERDGHADRDDHLLVGEDLLVALGRVLVAPDVLLAVDDDVELRAPWAAPAGRSRRTAWSRRRGCPARRCPTRAGFLIPGSLMKVTTVMKTRITAAPTVQPISRRVLPWIWAATRPRLALNLIRNQISAPSTPTKTITAMTRISA